MAFDVQELLTRGIDAWAETQQVRYGANDPTPQFRGNSDVSTPTGQPATVPAAEGISINTLLLIGLAAFAFWASQR